MLKLSADELKYINAVTKGELRLEYLFPDNLSAAEKLAVEDPTELSAIGKELDGSVVLVETAHSQLDIAHSKLEYGMSYIDFANRGLFARETELPTDSTIIALASPTGRAAKRLSQATGLPASTLHRLLGYSPLNGFKHDADNPLPVDILVVDEASMLDILLTYNLLKALAPGTHLLLVGDVDQLPSVGAGNVLQDIIDSGLVPVTRLELIFRQAAGSHIITNAHRINQGLRPTFLQKERKKNGFLSLPGSRRSGCR